MALFKNQGLAGRVQMGAAEETATLAEWAIAGAEIAALPVVLPVNPITPDQLKADLIKKGLMVAGDFSK